MRLMRFAAAKTCEMFGGFFFLSTNQSLNRASGLQNCDIIIPSSAFVKGRIDALVEEGNDIRRISAAQLENRLKGCWEDMQRVLSNYQNSKRRSSCSFVGNADDNTYNDNNNFRVYTVLILFDSYLSREDVPYLLFFFTVFA